MPFDSTNAKQHGATGGSIGGARGRGRAKVRGTPDYYRALVEKRAIFDVSLSRKGKLVLLMSYRDLAVAVRAMAKAPRGKVLTHPRHGKAVVSFRGDEATVAWETGEPATVYFQPWACRHCGAPTCFPYHSRMRLCDDCSAAEEAHPRPFS